MHRFACKLDNCIQVHNGGRKKRGIKGIKRVMEEQKVKDVCLFGGKVMLLRDEQLFKANDSGAERHTGDPSSLIHIQM